MASGELNGTLKVYFYQQQTSDGALLLGGVTASVPVRELQIVCKCTTDASALQFKAHLQARFKEIAS